MSFKNFIMGIDTSCYTSSLAIIDRYGTIVAEAKKQLEVKKGRRGLRQSDAFFQHVMNLPELLNTIGDEYINKISEIWVSTKPPNVAESYMPVFMAGFQFAKVISMTLNVPLHQTSHQEGHIMAVCMGKKIDYKKSYLAVHLSGGTTEILYSQFCENIINIQIVAKTLDISAGQLLDRIGVAVGLDFPAGPKLDELAQSFDVVKEKELKFPISLKGNDFNFSGAESWGMKYLQQEANIKYIADGLFSAIALSLYKSLDSIAKQTSVYNVIMTGGVSSSQNLRKKLLSLTNNSNLKIHFADAGYCVDNARGVAGMGLL